MKGKYLQFALGMVAGGLLFSTTATAADYLTAAISTQRFYLNGQPVQFEACAGPGDGKLAVYPVGGAPGRGRFLPVQRPDL